ncbi:hypothetical protein L1887_58027 [Cichorium endivia]|nr:hypothetical protein L1887_58027 [Cichorium endivia]
MNRLGAACGCDVRISLALPALDPSAACFLVAPRALLVSEPSELQLSMRAATQREQERQTGHPRLLDRLSSPSIPPQPPPCQLPSSPCRHAIERQQVLVKKKLLRNRTRAHITESTIINAIPIYPPNVVPPPRLRRPSHLKHPPSTPKSASTAASPLPAASERWSYLKPRRPRSRAPAHALLLAEQRMQGANQLHPADRLADVRRHAGLQTLLLVAQHGVRGERHNRHLLVAERLFKLADRHGRLDTPHDGHADVHQDHVVLALFDRHHGEVTVVHHVDLVALVGEDLARQLLVHHIVLGEQNVVRHLVGALGGRRCRALERGQQRIVQVGGRGGRVDVRADAVVEAVGQVERELRGRDEVDGDVAQVFDVAQVLHHGERVGNDGVDAWHAALAVRGFVDAVHGEGLETEILDHGLHACAVMQRVEVEDVAAGVRSDLLLDLVGRDLVELDDHGEEKVGALAVVAAHPQVAAHEVDEATRDGQTEAGAAVLARGGAVCLAEGVKDDVELVLLDANARVRGAELEHGEVAVDHLGELALERHAAAGVGELDGVSDEVGDDLLETQRIADERIGAVGRHLVHEVELLLRRTHRERLEHAEHDAAQREGDLFDVHAAGFDLGDVEDVVDDGEQVASERRDRDEVLALRARQLGLEGERGHADDAVHGRADLVRHVGEELGLGAVGELGGLPGGGVLLDTVAETVDHLVDLGLERVHLAGRLDGDEAGKVAVGGGGGDLGKGTHLRGEVVGHDVDVVRNLAPGALDVLLLGLHAELALGAHFASDTRDFGGKEAELVNHVVDGVDQVEHLAGDGDGDLLGEVTARDGGGGVCDGSHLEGQIGSHGVDRVCEVLPGSANTEHRGAASELAFGTDLLGDSRHLEREGSQGFHHVVDGQLEVEELAAHLDVDGLAEVAAGDGGGDGGDGSNLRGEVAGHHVDPLGEHLPLTLDVVDLGLTAEATFCADLDRDADDLVGERLELTHHVVDGELEVEDLALDVDVDELGEYTLGDTLCNTCDLSHLRGEVVGHLVDVFGEVLPGALDVGDVRLTAELAVGSDLHGHANDFGGKDAELTHHGVDGVLELRHLALGIDVDGLCEVALGDGGGDDADGAYLSGEVGTHAVDVVGELLPDALYAGHVGLTAELALGADFARDTRDFGGKVAELIDHDVDGDLEFEDLAVCLDFDLLGEVTARDGLCDEGDTAHLVGEVGGETIDDVLELLPGSFDAVHLCLTAELALGSYFKRDTGDFGGEMRETIDHLVDDVLEFDHDVTLNGDGDVLCEVAEGDGFADASNVLYLSLEQPKLFLSREAALVVVAFEGGDGIVGAGDLTAEKDGPVEAHAERVAERIVGALGLCVGERVGEGLAEEEVARVLWRLLGRVLFGAWGANDLLAASDDLEVVLCLPQPGSEPADVFLDGSCAFVAVGRGEVRQRQADGAVERVVRLIESEGREVRSGSGEEVVRDMNAAVTGDGEAPFSVVAMVDMGKEIDSIRPDGKKLVIKSQLRMASFVESSAEGGDADAS